MKRTYKKLLLRSVRTSISRFLAIFAIVALGTGFLAGLISTAPDMRQSVDTYYDDSRMMDIRVVSTLGLTAVDIADIAAADGVETVMPAFSADALLTLPDGDETVTRIHSLPDTPGLNHPVVTEGRLPSAAGECALLYSNYSSARGIGDVLNLAADNEDLTDTLAVEQFTVVGIVKSAYYLSMEKETSPLGSGKIQTILYTAEDSFALSVYTDAFVAVTGAATLDTFGEKYETLVDGVQDNLKTVGDTAASRRTAEIRSEAEQKLADGQADYTTAKAEADSQLKVAADKLDSARNRIADGEAQLNNKKSELASAGSKLADGETRLGEQQKAYATGIAAAAATLADTRIQLDKKTARLTSAKAELDNATAQIAAAKAQIADLVAAGMDDQAAAARALLETQKTAYESSLAEYTTGATVLAAAETEYSQGAAELENQRITGQQALDVAAAELTAARQQIADGKATIAAAEQKLINSKTELAQGEADYAAAKEEADAKLAEAEKKLTDARSAMDSIENASWYVLDRGTNVGYVSFDGNADKVTAIARVFPVFFFLVAALVSLTTMTRMVEEERTQIGTLKALGYSRTQIALKYLLYATAATALGSLFGLSVGFKVFPTVIWNAYGILYTQPALLTPFRWNYALLASGGCFVCTIGATLSACVETLKEKAARLMLPRAPKAGKRVFLEHITPLWSRMKFTHKVTARNLLRYKKRFWMTVIGVAGCTALLLTGFGLRDAINHIVSNQYIELYHHDLEITLEDADNARLNTLLAQAAPQRLHQESGTALSDNTQKDIYISVPSDPAGFADYVTLRSRKNHVHYALDGSGVLLTEKLADKLGVSAGDTVTLQNAEDRRAEFTVTAVVENYIYNYVYMTPEQYRSGFGTAAEPNRVLALTGLDSAGRDALAEELLKTDGVSAISFSQDITGTFSSIFDSINYIVLVLIVSAAALAFVVLYNLTNINITEREKEIATIKVLGFRNKEVFAYVYRETAILTIIGTFVGLAAGIFLCRFVVQTAEVEIVMFGRNIFWYSYVFSALITLLFSGLVSLAMMKKLRGIDMVESMKAGE